MISEKIEEAINKQINEELYSAYLYLAMAADLEKRNLKGAANWMKVQAQEELTHAMKFFDYLNERGGRVKLMEIRQPPFEWKSVAEIFREANKHEQYITAKINELMDLAIGEKDHATANMLQWFIEEQVEEEASTDEIATKFEMIGEDGRGVFMLDRELAARKFVDETEEG
ncbi:MAG: ferritin [Thermoplasmata archaeon]|nr:ferritin [Thermoplasmata archaeon]